MANGITFEEKVYKEQMDFWLNNSDEGKKYSEELSELKAQFDDIVAKKEPADMVRRSISEKRHQMYESFSKKLLETYGTYEAPSPESISESMNARESGKMQNAHWNLSTKLTPEEQAKRKELRLRLTEKMIYDAQQRFEAFDARTLYAEQMNRIKQSEAEPDLKYNSLRDYLEPLYEYKRDDFSTSKAVKDAQVFENPNFSESDVYKGRYNLIRLSVNKLNGIDFDGFANKDWSDDAALVENYELIRNLARVGETAYGLNGEMGRLNDRWERRNDRAIPQDPAVDQFLIKNANAIDKAMELSQRLSYIQNPYYDKLEMNDKDLRESFDREVVPENPEKLGADKIRISVGAKADERHKASGKIGRETTYQNDGIDMAKLTENTVNDLYDSWTGNEMQTYAKNYSVMRNTLRLVGCDAATLYFMTKDESGNVSYKSADGIISPRNNPTESELFNEYIETKSGMKPTVTMVDRANPVKNITLPDSAMMDPEFSKEIYDSITPNTLYKNEKEPPKPGFLVSKEERSKYERDKSLYAMKKLNREKYREIHKKEREAFQKKNPDADPRMLDKWVVGEYTEIMNQLKEGMDRTITKYSKDSDSMSELRNELDNSLLTLQKKKDGIENSANTLSGLRDKCDEYLEHCRKSPRSGGRRSSRIAIANATKKVVNLLEKGVKDPQEFLKKEVASKYVTAQIFNAQLNEKVPKEKTDLMINGREALVSKIMASPKFNSEVENKDVIELAQLSEKSPAKVSKSLANVKVNVNALEAPSVSLTKEATFNNTSSLNVPGGTNGRMR